MMLLVLCGCGVFFSFCCYGLGAANAMCLAHAMRPFYLPKSRLNVLLAAHYTSQSDRKSARQTAFASRVRPSHSAAGRAVAQPYAPFSYTAAKCLVLLTECYVGTPYPPKGRNVSSAASGALITASNFKTNNKNKTTATVSLLATSAMQSFAPSLFSMPATAFSSDLSVYLA